MKLLIVTQKVDKNDSILGFFHRWIQEFAKNVEFLTVICLYKGEYNLPENVKVLSLGKEEGESKIKYISRFYKYIWNKRKNYDSVFVHMNQVYVILGALLWRFLGKKIALWYAHGHVSLSLKVATFFSNIIFTSTEGGFRIKTPKKNIVGQGIDTELFSPSGVKRTDGIFRIITVGRISPVKDYDTLINAVEMFENKKGLEALIVGKPETKEDKSYYEKISNFVKNKNLDQVIRFLGAKTQKEVAGLLRESDLFVNMSHTGSLDKAILEAMSTGISVISSNESIKQLKSKFYIEPNDVTKLFAAIKVFVNGGNVQRRGNRNYVVKNHSIDGLIKKILYLMQKNV